MNLFISALGAFCGAIVGWMGLTLFYDWKQRRRNNKFRELIKKAVLDKPDSSAGRVVTLSRQPPEGPAN